MSAPEFQMFSFGNSVPSTNPTVQSSQAVFVEANQQDITSIHSNENGRTYSITPNPIIITPQNINLFQIP